MHGNDTIAAGTPSSVAVYNGRMIEIPFGSTLFPPKGNSYTIVIPPGIFSLKSDPTATNEELRYDFTVPAVIPKRDATIEENSVIAESDIVSFYFWVETAAVGAPEAILLREGVPVRSYPCDVTWDWDLGQAHVILQPPMHYENGVGYSWVLPAGSVSADLRSDIVNEEFRVNFTGGYTKPIKTDQPLVVQSVGRSSRQFPRSREVLLRSARGTVAEPKTSCTPATKPR